MYHISYVHGHKSGDKDNVYKHIPPFGRRWTTPWKGVPGYLIRIIRAMYKNAKWVINTEVYKDRTLSSTRRDTPGLGSCSLSVLDSFRCSDCRATRRGNKMRRESCFLAEGLQRRYSAWREKIAKRIENEHKEVGR